MATLTTKELIDLIKQDGKKPFSIRWVTLDSTRNNKPSKHMYLERAVECGANHDLVRHGQIGVKPADGDGHQYAVNIDLIYEINGQRVV